jgi:L-ascorbate metabolism protein UlaG (beta-lactamase superfamily)
MRSAIGTYDSVDMKNILFTVVFFLTIQSCTMVKISISEKRNKVPSTIKLERSVVLTTWGAIKINKTDFFPSSFQLKTDSIIIYIDPIEVGGSEKADYILITHQHPDHFSEKDIYKLKKSDTKIICSKGVAKKLHKIGEEIIVVRPNDIMSFNDFRMEAVPAYNTKPVFLWLKAHLKSKENVGFILTLGNSLRIYHAGDTDYIPEMDKISDIDLVLVPIGDDNLTMNEEEAAQIINKIKPKYVIPMHYEIKDTQKPDRFKELTDKMIEVIEVD